ncbi:hypothetical protein ACJJTC_009652 [Scirpophaga incertulas]
MSILLFPELTTAKPLLRQKRCIVVQKQSGSRDYDSDDDDEAYRVPQPKEVKPDRLKDVETNISNVEVKDNYDKQPTLDVATRFKTSPNIKKPNSLAPWISSFMTKL